MPLASSRHGLVHAHFLSQSSSSVRCRAAGDPTDHLTRQLLGNVAHWRGLAPQTWHYIAFLPPNESQAHPWSRTHVTTPDMLRKILHLLLHANLEFISYCRMWSEGAGSRSVRSLRCFSWNGSSCWSSKINSSREALAEVMLPQTHYSLMTRWLK